MRYNISRLIRKLTTKFIIFILIISVCAVIVNTPIITNEMAMLQMENDSGVYLIYETYNGVKDSIVSIGIFLIVSLFVASTARDVKQYFKDKEEHKND